MEDVWVEWEKKHSNPQPGDVAINPYDLSIEYRWAPQLSASDGRLMKWHWEIICQLSDCDNAGKWSMGTKVVCDFHKNINSFILYRHYSDTELLYIGITNDPPKRARGHKNSSEFWAEVTDGGYTTYERFPTKEDLLRAEKEAIQREEPKYNKQHNMIGVN
jgi:predicted GIY-YIG superfamily endonuclease